MQTDSDIVTLQELHEYLQGLGFQATYKTCWRMVSKEGWPGFKFRGRWHASKAAWREKLESLAAESAKKASRGR